MQDREAVHADLFRASQKDPMHVVKAADAASDRKRDEDVPCDVLHHFQVARTVFRTRRDIVKHEFIDAFRAILCTELHGIANIDVALETDSLGYLAVPDIQADDQPFCQHTPLHLLKFFRTRNPTSPLFSKWNCVATRFSRQSAETKLCEPKVVRASAFSAETESG